MGIQIFLNENKRTLMIIQQENNKSPAYTTYFDKKATLKFIESLQKMAKEMVDDNKV